MFVKRLTLMLALAFLLLNALPLAAQTNRGGIAGSVLDANGAPVANATVTVTNIGTNDTKTLTTSDDGGYNATLLEPVTYRIEVEAPGFKKAVIEQVKVDTSSVSTANIQLEVGAVTDEVTVVADAATAVNSENATVAQTITERQITDIPLQERSVLNLMLTLPNVSGDLISELPGTGTGILTPGQGLSVGGGRPGATSFLADGVNNTSSGSGRTVASFSPDTVQEFNVQTSNYSAEYGQTTGGIVNITTKSGTNQFHGTIAYYKLDPKISAAPFTIARTNRPFASREIKEYPITIGGPVYLPRFGEGGPSLYNGRDKTFFFFAFEPRRATEFGNVFNLFPTEAMRGGDFRNVVQVAGGHTTSDVIASLAARGINVPVTGDATIYQNFAFQPNGLLTRCPIPAAGQTPANLPAGCPVPAVSGGVFTYQPFANQVIPTQFLDPTAQQLLRYLPLPNSEPFIQPNGNLANWVGRRNSISDDNRYQFRVDHQISEANKIYFRYSHIPITGYRFNNLDPAQVESDGLDQVNALIGDKQTSDQFVLSDTHIFSPTLVNELRLGYSRGNFSRVNPPIWQTEGFAQMFGLPSVTDANLPLFNFGAINNVNLFRGIGNENITLLGDEIDESFQISDTFTKTSGNMTFKFGTDLRHLRLKTAPVQRAAGGEYGFSTTQTSNRGTNTVNRTGGNPFASFLLGVPNGYAYRTTVLPYYYRWASGALFIQDDWKVKPNLTLNLGIRYALQLPRWEKFDRQGSFLPELAVEQTLTQAQRRTTAINVGLLPANAPADVAIPAGIPTTASIVPFGFANQGGRSRYLLPIDKNGWEPRLGFAWVPNIKFINRIFGEGNLVLRGGYGLSHSPLTGLGSAPTPDFAAGSGANITYDPTTGFPQGSGQCDTNFNVRLSTNPPCVTSLTPEEVVGTIPEDGLIYANSIKYNAFDISSGTKTPKSEQWSLTAAFSFSRGNVLELSYTGNRATNLFLPAVNLNRIPLDISEAINERGLDPAANVTDPLGRLNITNGVVTTPRASLLGPYFGFSQLPVLFNSAGNSIRHSGSAYFRGRAGQSLRYTVAYTFSKSIDTGSDAGSSAVANVFSSRSDGHVRFGAPLNEDRSVSTFDQPHVLSGTFLWDLPVGRGGWFWKEAPAIIDHLIGGFTLSGTYRFQSGYPFAAFVTGNNGLDVNSGGSVRLSVNPDSSIPYRNPLWTPDCPIGTTCQPFINPAKFIRPPIGELGNGPRTYGNIRGPRQEFFDLSLQKNFYVFGKDSKKRFQLRLDATNVLNHPNLGFASIGGGTGFVSGRGPDTPNQDVISQADYNLWAQSWNQLHPNDQVPTANNNATFQAIQSLVSTRQVRAPGVTTGGRLPRDFYTIPIPSGIAQDPFGTYDIRTLEGYKLFRLSQVWNDNFGTLSPNLTFPRRLQYQIKFIF